MKKIFTFTLNKEIESEEVQISKDEKGQEVKTLVKVKKNEPHNYFIARPNRVINDGAEMFYQKIFWQCQKEGILPMSQLSKRIIQDGGILTEEESGWRDKAFARFFELQSEQKALNDKKDKTTEENEKLKSLTEEIVNIYSDLQEFEQQKVGNLHQNTAESIAKNRQSMYWALFLSHEDLGNEKYVPIFGNGDYEDRLKVYDNFEEKDERFTNQLIQRLFLACSLWNLNKIQTQEEFEISVKAAEKQGLIDAIETITKLTEENKLPEIKEAEKPKESVESEAKS